MQLISGRRVRTPLIDLPIDAQQFDRRTTIPRAYLTSLGGATGPQSMSMGAGPMLTISSLTVVRIRLAMHLLLLPALDCQTREATWRQELLLLALGQHLLHQVQSQRDVVACLSS